MIKISPNFILRKYKYSLFFFGILGFILVFISTSQYGASLSPDSVQYIGTARNIISGNGYTLINGKPLIAQPPLFPTVLALFGLIFRIDPISVANLVNSLTFGLIVFFGGFLTLKYFTNNPNYILITSLAILISPPLFMVSVYAWSEPLFILFVILSFIFGDAFIEKNDLKSLIFLSLFVGLTTLTRYIGVVSILWGAIIIIVYCPESIKNKIKKLTIFLFISLTPIGIWLLRNYRVSNTFFGTRYQSVFTLSNNINILFDNVMNWFVPDIISNNNISLFLLGLSIGLILDINLKNAFQYVKLFWKQIGPLVLFFIFYISFLVISSSVAAYDKIDFRLLSPIYVPLTIFLIVIFKDIISRRKKNYSESKYLRIIYFFLVFWFFAYPLYITTTRVTNQISNGQGYSSKSWTESETILYLLENQSLKSDCTFYSNEVNGVYLLSQIKAKQSPLRKLGYFNSTEPNIDINDLRLIWPEELNACLIWFNNINRSYVFSLDELMEIINIDLIVDLEDGSIYSINKK